MITVRDIVKALPAELREQVIANLLRQYVWGYNRQMAATGFGCKSVIGGTFCWEETPEGWQYWSGVYDSYGYEDTP